MKSEMPVGSDALFALSGRLKARSDNAYIDYISRCGNPACLGWEAKVEKGTFGLTELEAHKAAAEKLGRHRALMEAHNLLDEILKANAQGQPPASETTPTNQTFPVAATRNDPPTWRPFLSKNGTSDPLDRHPSSPRRNCFECGCCRAWNHHPDCWTGRLEKFIANDHV